MTSPYLAYALITIGLLILAFTFVLGYVLYQNLNSGNFNINQKVTGSNLSAIEASTFQNIIGPADANVYTVISVFVLFLFGNIGYKFAIIGVRMTEGNKPEKKPEPQKKLSKSKSDSDEE